MIDDYLLDTSTNTESCFLFKIDSIECKFNDLQNQIVEHGKEIENYIKKSRSSKNASILFNMLKDYLKHYKQNYQ